MPVGKYYCDYCEKEFQDTPEARRRHLQSSYHLRSKTLWYDSLRERNHANELPRGVCHRFLKTGVCSYGDSCKYYHPKTTSEGFTENGNTQMTWGTRSTQTALANQYVGGSSLQANPVVGSMTVSWGDLPPSLMPPPEGGYPLLPIVDWG